MANNIELARAYVTIVPSMEGSQQAIAEQMAGIETSMSDQGSSAGSSFGASFASGLVAAGSIALAIGSEIASGLAQGAQALAEFTTAGGQYADDVLTMSTNTHIAADELQAYMYAAELVDVSVETMTSTMARNIRSMSSAAEGTGAAAEAYAALGVAVTDQNGNLRDSQEVYWDLIDALGEVDDYTQRDSLAMTIFGRSAQQLNSLIAVGSEGMQEYASQAEAAGAILDGDTLDAFHNFDDVSHQLEQGMDAAKNALGTILLPILTEMGTSGVSLLGEFTNGILDANGDIEQMGEVVNQIAPRLSAMISEYLPSIVSIATTLISTLASALVSNLPTILSSAGEILRAIGQGIIDVMPSLGPVVADLIVGFVSFLLENLPAVISGAVSIVVAVCDGISRALPELIPSAVACVEQIVVALIDSIDLLLPAALELMLALALGLVACIPDLLNCIPTIADALRNELTEVGPSIANAALTWGADLIDNFISGITSGIGRLTDTVASIASTVSDYLAHSVPKKGPLAEGEMVWGSDMIDNFIMGINDEAPELEATLNRTLSIPSVMDAPNDVAYTPSGSSEGGNLVIPVYIGQEQLDTILIRSEQLATYRRGG